MHNKYQSVSQLSWYVRTIAFLKTSLIPIGQCCPVFIPAQLHWFWCYSLNKPSMFAPQDRYHVVLSTWNASSLSLSWMLLTPFSLFSNVTSSERAPMTTYLKWHRIPQPLSFLLCLFPLYTISGTCILLSVVYLFMNCLSPRIYTY